MAQAAQREREFRLGEDEIRPKRVVSDGGHLRTYPAGSHASKDLLSRAKTGLAG